MSFDKDYPNRKDRRRPYRDARRFDRTCRHGGSCGYCRRGRTFKRRMAEAEARDRLREHEGGGQ